MQKTKFDYPALKFELADLSSIVMEEGKWVYCDMQFQLEVKLLWIQGIVSNISSNKDEIQLSKENVTAIVTNCHNIPGGNQWIEAGLYVMVIGEVQAIQSTWNSLQVKAIKVSNLTTNPHHQMMWQYEVQEAKKLYKLIK